MKFFILLILLSIISTSGSAATENIVVIGKKTPEILWLEERTINKREVRLIGFQTVQKNKVERVLPHKEYANLLAEFNQFKNNLIKKQIPFGNPGCSRPVLFGDKDISEICMERLNKKDRTLFVRWFKLNAKLAAGIY